ncbi:hypothetical protein ZWY2020_032793 [Hordeum vulgare]|nr:hypothetical protein ZWY2020_032793 [Hordeum vulgare]
MGSRFSCLHDDEEPLEDDLPAPDNSLSSAARRRKSDEELAQDFWEDIGFLTPESRVWEQPPSRRSGEGSFSCRSSAQEDPILKEKAASPVEPCIQSVAIRAMEMRATVRSPLRSVALVRP